jgi:6-pyruvoyl-tetrahydropterin synthase
MQGVAEQVTEEIDFHTLYNLSENITEALPTAEQYLLKTLTDLGIHEQEDLTLIEPEDLFYQGVESWIIEPFKEKHPHKVDLPELKLSVEYFFKAKRLTVHYVSGARKEAPKRWELPAWQGFKIQYKKASKVVDVK